MRTKTRVRHVVAALIALAIAIALIVYLPEDSSSEPFEYSVRVQSAASSEPIFGALVLLDAPGEAPKQEFTDSSGYARIMIGEELVGQPGRLIVEAQGYEIHIQAIDILPVVLPNQIRLDPNESQSTESTIPDEVATSSTVSAISAGVVLIDQYVYRDILDRLKTLEIMGEWIDSNSGYQTLQQYDVIYLPTGWAYEGAIISANKAGYLTYLESGGGLLIEQPNLRDEFTPWLLPYPVTFRLGPYDPTEWPPVIINLDHFIVKDLGPHEVPGPENEIVSSAPEYDVLVTSQSSRYPTLLAATYGSGRLAIITASASPSEDRGFSDELYRRLFVWLSGNSQ